MMQMIHRSILFFVVVMLTGCLQFTTSGKTEFLIKFEDGSSGQVVFMSRYSSFESGKVISEIVGITDSEGKVEFKELPVPFVYKISIMKNGERKLLVGYMLGKGAAGQNHTLTIHKDGGTSGLFGNKN